MHTAALMTLDELISAAADDNELHDALDERRSTALAIEHLAGPVLPYIRDRAICADNTPTCPAMPEL